MILIPNPAVAKAVATVLSASELAARELRQADQRAREARHAANRRAMRRGWHLPRRRHDVGGPDPTVPPATARAGVAVGR